VPLQLTCSVGVPKAYKSKSSFLKVTTSYQVNCVGGDEISSRVAVGGVGMSPDALVTDTSAVAEPYQTVTKVYYLPSEKVGGAAVPPDSEVVLQLTSSLGSGCFASFVTMVVEVLK